MYTIFMRGIHFIVVLFLFNLTLVRSYDNKSVTATKTDKRGNVPIIKSSSSSIYFEDQFQDEAKWSLWTKSQAKKDIDRSIARYDGDWSFEIPESSVYKNDYGLVSKVLFILQLIFFLSCNDDSSRKPNIMQLAFIYISHLIFQQISLLFNMK